MNSTAVANRPNNQQAQTIEEVLLSGNLKNLGPADRVVYHDKVCQSLGLNPLTRPFDYLELNGKVVLYARKDATDQLRKLNAVDITDIARERIDDLYLVTVSATDKTGRRDSSTGAVSVAGLKGEALANALMKAETKAKRRVTLSICGLGMLDETETDFDDDPPAPRINMPTRLSERTAPRDGIDGMAADFDRAEREDARAARNLDPETGEIPFTWTANDLNDVLKKRAIALADLSGFLGAECNKETFPDLIDAWLKANPGATLETMADAAIEFAMNGTPQQPALT
jgi:hypothetical protein